MFIPSNEPVGTVLASPDGRKLAICQQNVNQNDGNPTWWIHHLYQPYSVKEMQIYPEEILYWKIVYQP